MLMQSTVLAPCMPAQTHPIAPYPTLRLQKVVEGVNSVEGCEAKLFQVGAGSCGGCWWVLAQAVLASSSCSSVNAG